MAMAALFMISSCGSDHVADVAAKISSGATLTQAEYTTVIDYLGHFAKSAQPLQDQINNLPAGDPKAVELQQQLDRLKEKDIYLDLFSSMLARTPRAAGIELQTPSSDSVSVVAGAVDQLEVK